MKVSLRASGTLAVTVLAVGIWWFICSLEVVSTLVLPTPSVVATALLEILAGEDLYVQTVITLVQIGIALAIALVGGIALGLPIGWWRTLQRAYEPMLANVFAIPLVVFYPVLLLLLGIGASSKIAFGAIYAFFPVAIATVTASAGINPVLVQAGRAMGARRTTLLKRVILPAALPGILGGVRLGVSLCIVAVVAAQYIGGTEGLGLLLATAGERLDTPKTFAYVTVTLVLALAINTAVSRLIHYLERNVV
jgi:NitT/TauT family transport system permease protein